MALLSSLTFNAGNPKEARATGITSMRQKLIDRIEDQIGLAKARDDGQPFQRVRHQRPRGADVEAVVRTRVRPWWVQDKGGSILLWIKYGSHALELQKGKPAIRLKGKDDLIPTLETVRDAVQIGELDKLILDAVAGFKMRSKKLGG